jgi:hypothetical protein
LGGPPVGLGEHREQYVLNGKPPIKDKVKGVDYKRKMDAMDSLTHKKARKGWTVKHCSLCNKHFLPVLIIVIKMDATLK